MIGDRAVFGMVSDGGVDVSEGGVDVMSEGGGGIGSSGSTDSTGTNRLVTLMQRTSLSLVTVHNLPPYHTHPSVVIHPLCFPIKILY